MIGGRVLRFITRILDAQEQAIGLLSCATNLGLEVEFVNALFISPKMVTVLPSITRRHILYGHFSPLGRTQFGAEGGGLGRTIVILQHLHRPGDLTPDGKFAGISHNAYLFEDR